MSSLSQDQKRQLKKSCDMCKRLKYDTVAIPDANLFTQEYMDDQEAPCCQLCAQPFTLFFRRHHCRRCNIVYCNECCFKTKSDRLCTICYTIETIEKEGVSTRLKNLFESIPALNQLLQRYNGDEKFQYISRFSFTQLSEAFHLMCCCLRTQKDIDYLLQERKDEFETLLKMAVKYIVNYSRDEFTTNANDIDDNTQRLQFKKDDWSKITYEQQACFCDIVLSILTNVLEWCDKSAYETQVANHDDFKTIANFYIDNFITGFEGETQKLIILFMNNILSFHQYEFLNKDSINKLLLYSITQHASLASQILCVLNFKEASDEVVQSVETKIRNLIMCNDIDKLRKVAACLYGALRGKQTVLQLNTMQFDAESGYDMACQILLGLECNQYAKEIFDYTVAKSE